MRLPYLWMSVVIQRIKTSMMCLKCETIVCKTKGGEGGDGGGWPHYSTETVMCHIFFNESVQEYSSGFRPSHPGMITDD